MIMKNKQYLETELVPSCYRCKSERVCLKKSNASLKRKILNLFNLLLAAAIDGLEQMKVDDSKNIEENLLIER
ncbi:unnamed protein product [Arabis nemorensis]|uniref:Uncharacterized protein n=1 Tax=Arabis nemorensis TaxID=586526 RepID=A0A565BSK3_9BRAS|nr:unnamed protein product [Arabis nemorensis]